MLSRKWVLICLVGLTLFSGVPKALGAGIEQIDLRVEGMT